MLGLGIGELVLLFLVGFVAISTLMGFDLLKQARKSKQREVGFERRVLDELEVLSLRLDMISKRLDAAGIGGPEERPRLSGDSD